MLENELAVSEQLVRQSIEAFDHGKNTTILLDACRLTEDIAVESGRADAAQANNRVAKIILLILDQSFRERDFHVDLKKPDFTTKVAPALGSAPHVYAGMPPEMIKDPAVRKEYIDAVAKNESMKKKYFQQRNLQDILDRGLWQIINRIGGTGTLEERIVRTREFFGSSVTDIDLRDYLIQRLDREEFRSASTRIRGGTPIEEKPTASGLTPDYSEDKK